VPRADAELAGASRAISLANQARAMVALARPPARSCDEARWFVAAASEIASKGHDLPNAVYSTNRSTQMLRYRTGLP
jgi:hypothetical protein